jgi:hypothetical protein
MAYDDYSSSETHSMSQSDSGSGVSTPLTKGATDNFVTPRGRPIATGPSSALAPAQGRAQVADLRPQSQSGLPSPAVSSNAQTAAFSPVVQVKSQPEITRRNEFALPVRSGAPLDGIIAFITKKCNGNVHEKGVVEVIGKAYNAIPNNAAKKVADLTSNSNFYSVDEPDQSVCYDFRKLRIKPTHYTIRSACDGYVDYSNLKSWVIEVSDDGREWTEIDRRENNNELNAKNVIKTFQVQKSVECRFFRLRQIDKNHRGYHHIVISSFEVFGTLYR